MSKKTTIFIIILTIILGTGILYVLLGGKGLSDSPLIPGNPFGSPPDDVTPDGSDGGTSTTTTSGGIDVPVDSEGKPLARLFKLSDAPVAGALSFLKNGSTTVRYVDRATGHVYEVNLTNLERVKILNTTRPHVYEVIFKQDGSGFVERTVAPGSDTVINTSISLIAPTSTSTSQASSSSAISMHTAEATLLRGELEDITLLHNNNLIYALKDTGSVMTSSFSGENPRTLFTLPFTKWNIRPISNTSAILSTKPSSEAEGYAYTLNITSGSLTKMLGPLTALSVLPSSDGRRIAYSYTKNGANVLSVDNTLNGTSLEILPATLSEKCVWSKQSTNILICAAGENGLEDDAPDAWYQGLTHYSDKIWRFNTDTETAEILLSPKANFDIDIDVINLILSPNEDYLFFTNKTDLSLWALKLESL
ncbi:MAG: hypothetical protein ACYCY6_01810 [Minisyncoccota bacterium]